jgi:hypothetical protein
MHPHQQPRIPARVRDQREESIRNDGFSFRIALTAALHLFILSGCRAVFVLPAGETLHGLFLPHLCNGK